MSELLTHHFAVMSDRQIARKLLSLAAFVGKNETGIAKEKSIALLTVAANRLKAKMKPRQPREKGGSIMKKEVMK